MIKERDLQTKKTGESNGAVRIAVGILQLVFLILLGMAVTAGLADYWWVAELFLDMQWHVLLAALVVVPTAFCLRRYWVGLGSLLIIVSCLIQLQPWSNFQRVEPKRETETSIKIVFWNVFVGNHDPRSLLSLAEANNVDMVVLLEYSHRLAVEMEPMRRRFPVSHELPSADAFGMAVFSRLNGEFEVFQLDENTPTICFHTSDSNGTKVDVWATHVFPPINGQGWSSRNQQMKKLAEILRAASPGTSGPATIVGGDLNCVSWATPFKNLVKQSQLKACSHRLIPRPTWPTSLGMLGIQIDHVLHSSHIEIADSILDSDDSASDHAAVIVEAVCR